jgi:hypothetical protein
VLLQSTRLSLHLASRAFYAASPADRDASLRDALDSAAPSFAYATLLSSADFLPAVQVLIHSLAKTGPSFPLLLCALVGRVDEEQLRAAVAAATEGGSLTVLTVWWQPLPPPPRARHPHRWRDNWAKLRLWQLTDYTRILYLDADCLVLRSLEAVFATRESALPGFSFLGTPDWGRWTRRSSRKMNGGVFLMRPSLAAFSALVAFSEAPERYRSQEAEQGLFNSFFGERRCCLDYSYNAQKTLSRAAPQLFDLGTLHTLHFVGEKPWAHWGDEAARRDALGRLTLEERGKLAASDLLDDADFSELHALWRAAYLEMRAAELRKTLLLLSTGGEGDGAAASRAHWPFPPLQKPARAGQLPACALLAAAGGSRPQAGLVRPGRQPPPPWLRLRFPPAESAGALPVLRAWPDFDSNGAAPALDRGEADWVEDLATDALSRSPALAAVFRLHSAESTVDSITDERIELPSTAHIGRRRRVGGSRVILSAKALNGAAANVRAAMEGLFRGSAGGADALGEEGGEALCEHLLNVWAAEEEGGGRKGGLSVVWL